MRVVRWQFGAKTLLQGRMLTLKTRKAFTLVEILVAITIILILIGIALPVLISARHRAKVANDLSQMKQIALAGVLYQEQNGALPQSCATLVDAGMIPVALCSAMADPSPEGQANEFLTAATALSTDYARLKTPYRNSFLGLRELFWTPEMLEKKFEGANSKGWLVNLNQTAPVTDVSWKGTYYRILDDGGLLKRTVFLGDQKGGGSEMHYETLFGDFPADKVFK
jgi:prepilin-type N-terminal cleavage/methylation domain-containing protein